MPEKADIIVVGLGPIGAYAAWQFARRGLNVIALEQQPAGAPPSNIGVFHFEREAFDRTGVPLPPPAEVVCVFPGATIHAPDPKRFVEVKDLETWALDLNTFIRRLRDLAKEAGAQLIYGAQVSDLLHDRGRVAGVAAQTKRGAAEYRGTITVDATGLARTLRRRLPVMNFPGGDKVWSVYMEYWTEPEPAPRKGLHSYMGANCWTAEYPDYWIVGKGQPAPQAALQAEHAAWVTRHLPGKRKVLRRVAGAIPLTFPPPTLVDDGLVVLGDAAATNKPFNGEGIASGVALAKIAAEEMPRAVMEGGAKAGLWEINRRYFTDQGAKFAFIRTLGLALLELTDEELNRAFEIALITGEDLRQTFLSYQVKKSPAKMIVPLARLLRHGRMAKKYAAAVFQAVQAARLFGNYPTPAGFNGWHKNFIRLMEH